LAGRPPFLEDSIAELVRSMLEAPPSLRGMRADVPEPLEAAILCCLQREPAQRYADVGVLASTLARFAPEMRLHAERARRVLGNSEPRSGSELAVGHLASTLAVDSRSGVSAPPTVTAWGEHHPRERNPLVRRAGIALAVLLTLVAVGLGLRHSSRPDVPRVASASSALPTPPEPVQPAPPVAAVTVSPPATTELASTPPPVPSARAAVVGNKPPRAAAKKAAHPSEVPSVTGKDSGSGVPDFGGRR